jgi:TPR repeat protein
MNRMRPPVDEMPLADSAAQAGDYAAALAIWGPLAHAGNARAQNNIGACFSGGLGVGARSHGVLAGAVRDGSGAPG